MKLLLLIPAMFFLSFSSFFPDGYEVGEAVSDFSVKSTSGEMISLSDYSDEKGIILIFDCNTCPYSQGYNTRIKELHSKYADQGFPVLAINPNDPTKAPGDSFDKMVAYADSKNYSHEYAQDQTQEVARAFGATNTPHVFVLNNDSGTFKVAYIGAIDNNPRDGSAATKHYVEDAVDALLKGNNPKTTSAKAIGCTIKWKES